LYVRAARIGMPCFNKGWQAIHIVFEAGIYAFVRYRIVIHLPARIETARCIDYFTALFFFHALQSSVTGFVFVFNGVTRRVSIFIGVAFGIVGVKVSKNAIGGNSGVGSLGGLIGRKFIGNEAESHTQWKA